MTKTCVMCRKEVDPGASLCPYCNSSVDYTFFKAVPSGQMMRRTNKTKELALLLILFAVTAGCFWLGLTLGGIWIGVGAAAIGYKVFTAIEESFPSDVYHHRFCCPGCSHEQDSVWNAKQFDLSKSGFMECPNCRKKTMLAIA